MSDQEETPARRCETITGNVNEKPVASQPDGAMARWRRGIGLGYGNMSRALRLVASGFLLGLLSATAHAASDGDLRLQDEIWDGRGRLEIFHASEWGGVCDDDFGDVDAGVACRQLGYGSGTASADYLPLPDGMPFWLDDIGCTGTESRLADCRHPGWGKHNCSEIEAARIACEASPPDPGSPQPPDEPGAPTLEALSTSSIRIGWTAPTSDSPITGYHYQYRSFRLPRASRGSAWVPGTTTGTELTLTGLRIFTRYEVQIRATSANGTGGWSPRGSGRTHGVPLVPDQVQAIGSTDSTLTVSWVLTPSDPAATDFDYRYRARTNPRPAWTWVDATTITGSPTTIEALDPETDYEFQIRAENSVGHGSWSVSGTGRTEPPRPRGPASEGDLRLEDGPSDSHGRLEVFHNGRWGGVCHDDFEDFEAIVACRQLGHTSGLPELDFRPLPYEMPMWLDFSGSVGCTGTESRLVDCPHLAWGTSSCHQNHAVSISCTGTAPDPDTAQPPDIPAAPAVRALSTSSIRMTWAAPASDSPITEYEYRHRRFRLYGGPDGEWVTGTTTATEVTLTGLTTLTHYEVQVRAKSANGTGGWSPRGSGRTQGIPNRPDAVQAADSTASGLTVTWTPTPSDPATTDFDYRYRERTDPRPDWTEVTTTDITGPPVEIGELDANTSYEFQIRAVNSVGAGAWSSSGTGRTDPPEPDPARDPAFASDTASRSMDEFTSGADYLTALGDPVTATDPNGDTLTYTLGGPGRDHFAIDSRTGQLSVPQTYETGYYDHERVQQYQVTVTATDPDGRSDTITVTIHITNVNESPYFTIRSSPPVLQPPRRIFENAAAGTLVTGRFPAVDPDGDSIRYEITTGLVQEDTDGDGLGDTWVKSIMDGDKFTVDDTGQLRVAAGAVIDYEAIEPFFTSPPSFRDKRVLWVQLKVDEADGSGRELSYDARRFYIEVRNVAEPGLVELTGTPQVGSELNATLTDPDGGVRGVAWQWRTGEGVTGPWTAVSGATGSSYTPVAADVGKYLSVRAQYTDAHGSGKSAWVAADAAVQAAPAPALARLSGTVPVAPPSPGKGCRVNVGVRFVGDDGTTPIEIASLAASDFTAENGRVGTPVAASDGLSWTVPAWSSAGLTGVLRVRLVETGRWRAGEQAFRVTGGESCAVAARNELASLALGDLALDPAYDAGTTAYTAQADADIERTTVTALEVYGTASVSIVPVDVDEETDGHQLALAEGETEVTVTVTPGDGSAAKTYTVTVTREAAASPVPAPANLRAVGGDEQVTLTWTAPEYDGSITGYEYRLCMVTSLTQCSYYEWESTESATSHTVKYYRYIEHGGRRHGFHLLNGRKMRFQVRALAGDVEGLATAEVEATTAAAPETVAPRVEGTEVPSDWSLLPSGIGPGEGFRLLVVTSTSRNAEASGISAYDSHALGAVGAGHAAIREHAAMFRALACTQDVDARSHTGTTGGGGVPVYWLNGGKVADDYADLYDGSWATNAPRDERGEAVPGNTVRVFTGCASDGTGEDGFELGHGWRVAIGRAKVNGVELNDPGTTTERQLYRRIYALSPVFVRAGAASAGTLSVADARAEEGTDATLDFVVTLQRSGAGAVTVDYATSDGSATAGDDYTATSGTLTFSSGETSKTVSVPVLDDAIDEGEETMTLTLSNPSGLTVADGTATGTIANSDHMPAAWLARFGRTVSGQVLDAVVVSHVIP